MRTKVQKWGNSLAVRIPKAFAREARVAYGTSVEISVDEGRLVIDPCTDGEFRLEDLLHGITRDNVHNGVETGRRVGKEAW